MVPHNSFLFLFYFLPTYSSARKRRVMHTTKMSPNSTPHQPAQDIHANIMPWRYNDMVHIVTHEAQSCNTCSEWALHYMSSAFKNDESLRRAEDQRADVIRGDLAKENATLRESNESLRRKLDAVRKELDKTRHKLNDADDEVHYLHDIKHDLQRRADATIDGLQSQVDALQTQIRDLERDQTPRRRKIARHGSRTPSPSCSRQPSVQSTRYEWSLVEDQDDAPAPRSSAAPPHLLPRSIVPSTPPSSTSLPVAKMPLPSSAEISPSAGDNFLARLADAVPNTVSLDTDATIPALATSSFSPTPFADYVRFRSLLPVIFYAPDRSLTAAPGSIALDADGNIDFNPHPRFVLALGGLTPDGQPAWHTSLIRREHLLTPKAIQFRAARIPIPLAGVVLGGDNGVLISPDQDPTTEAQVVSLFGSAKRHKHAAGYVERIRFTPPELREDFHQRALERWPEVQAARRAAQSTNLPRRPEPSPSANISIWKRWLREMREHPQSGGAFKYIGIPLVGQGYQTAHLEGARAMLSFLPFAPKGGTIRGPLRDAFLRSAAALLCVPERYSQVLAQLGQDIAHGRRAQHYNEARFGYGNNLGVNEVARFLASVGVTPGEAEQWRPWAAAYIDMELEEHPNGSHAQTLRQARDRARARIDSDSRWVFRNVHQNAPGNYNPAREQARAARGLHRSPHRPEASSSSNAKAGPSSVAAYGGAHLHLVYPDNAGEGDVHLGYENDQDEDSRMGPA